GFRRMILSELLHTVQIIETIGSTGLEISAVEFDSRKIQTNSLFVALSGTQVDGHDFISKSISSGAIAIVCEKKPTELNPAITYVVVENSSIALGKIASNLYGNPTKKLKLIGITGTNGKTTTATLTHHLLEALGYPTVLISTIRILI